MRRKTTYTPIKPQSAPMTRAATKPLRKNSYSKGANIDINVQIVQKVETVQAVDCFDVCERLSRYQRVPIKYAARAGARRSSPNRRDGIRRARRCRHLEAL